MAELVNEVKLGVTKGSEIEETVKMNFNGETGEVGLYQFGDRLILRSQSGWRQIIDLRFLFILG